MRIILFRSDLFQIWSEFIGRKILKLTDSEKTCFIDDYGFGPYKGPRPRFTLGKYTPFHLEKVGNN